MIAEAPVATTTELGTINTQRETRNAQPLTVGRVVSSLQLLLATRRAARNDDHAYWYTVARGM